MHSCLSPSSSEALFPWTEWPTSTPAFMLMALAQLSLYLLVSGSTLATVLFVCSEKCLDKAVPDKMSHWNSGKEEKFNEYNPIHVLQTNLLSLLLARSQALTKSESVYRFPKNSTMPTSRQWKERYCVSKVSHAVGCRLVLVSRILFGELLGVYQR